MIQYITHSWKIKLFFNQLFSNWTSTTEEVFIIIIVEYSWGLEQHRCAFFSNKSFTICLNQILIFMHQSCQYVNSPEFCIVCEYFVSFFYFCLWKGTRVLSSASLHREVVIKEALSPAEAIRLLEEAFRCSSFSVNVIPREALKQPLSEEDWYVLQLRTILFQLVRWFLFSTTSTHYGEIDDNVNRRQLPQLYHLSVCPSVFVDNYQQRTVQTTPALQGDGGEGTSEPKCQCYRKRIEN